MTYAFLAACYEKMHALAERIASGRLPTVRIALWALAVGMVFTTFPNYPRLLWDEEFERTQCSWNAVLDKRDNLFLDLGTIYPAGSHNTASTFRLTVPLIAKLLGLGKLGIFVFQSACGLLLLWVVARLVQRTTGDLVASLFVTCGVASTWAGTTGFIELRGLFDGEALLLLSSAMLFESAWLAGPLTFLGAWTDERALIASSLVFLFHVFRRQRRGLDWRTSYFGATPIAIVGAGIAYLVLRFAMARHFHVASGTMTATVGLKLVILDANNLAIGIWSALEGGWLLVFAAIVILARMRRIVFALLYIAAIAMVLVVSMSVLDITRSMAYALPALFIAIEVLREVESDADLRILCAATSIVSIFWPNYSAVGAQLNFWNVPLPMRLLEWCLHSLRR